MLPELIPYRKGNKWGFCDKDKNLIIIPKYENASLFNEELAVVKLNGKYGYIDKNEKPIIPFNYSRAYNFVDGLAIAGNELVQFIDKSGKAVSRFYNLLFPFIDGFAISKVYDENPTYGFGHYGMINRSGSEIIPNICKIIFSPYKNGYVLVKKENGYFFIDTNGKYLNNIHGYLNAEPFSDDIAAVCDSYNYWHYINIKGERIFTMLWDLCKNFSEGLAPVRLSNDKYGFIDKQGKNIIQHKYDYADSFSEGLACVGLNRKFGFIDKNDSIVVHFNYERAFNFKEGLAIVWNGQKYGLIDKFSNEITPCIFDEIGKLKLNTFIEEFAIVKINDKFGFIDKQGNTIIKCKYYGAENFKDGLALIKSSFAGNQGYIDKNGTEFWED